MRHLYVHCLSRLLVSMHQCVCRLPVNSSQLNLYKAHVISCTHTYFCTERMRTESRCRLLVTLSYSGGPEFESRPLNRLFWPRFLVLSFAEDWSLQVWRRVDWQFLQADGDTVYLHIGIAVPLQAWSGPECSRKLRFPDYMTTVQDGGKVVSLTHRTPLPPGNAPGTHFC
jgi:hypothetical protein